MSEILMYSRVKSRSDTDGLGSIKSWDDGTDTIRVKIPSGKKFTRYAFYNESVLGSASIIKAPVKNATGTVEFKVRWNYLMMGKSQYRLYAYCIDQGGTSSAPLIIHLESSGWEQQAYAAIAQEIPFTIRIRGFDASIIGNALRQNQGSSRRDILNSFSPTPRFEPVTVIALTAVIVFGVIAVVGFVTLAYVLSKSIDEGQCPKANFKTNGPDPISSELDIDVRKC